MLKNYFVVQYISKMNSIEACDGDYYCDVGQISETICPTGKECSGKVPMLIIYIFC